jgi:microcystin-dependent protein
MKIKSIILSALMMLGVTSYAQDGYIGEIRLFAGNFPPKGWAFCDGTMLAINTNAALFSILGTTYGGNGVSTFALPDLRGRVAVHAGYSTGPGLSLTTLGEVGGKETVTVANSLPILSTTGTSIDATTTGRDGAPWVTQSVTLQSTDKPQYLDNMQPYLGLNYIICIYGIFPARN